MVGHLGFSETVLADDLVVRNGIFYKKFTDVPFIGDVIGHQNGTVINGKRDGFWESYYPTGKILGQGYFRDGLRDGKFFSYHDNGTIEYEGNFKDGNRIGCWRLFKDDGLLIKEEHF